MIPKSNNIHNRARKNNVSQNSSEGRSFAMSESVNEIMS